MRPQAIFFLAGGGLFILVALFLSGVDNEAAHIVALTFGIIGICWIVPQLIIYMRQRDR
ncbi:MAG: hypothetical protein QOH68_313 [Nocardioidaceae bacterium]|jgi:hypothetical protein|nr:hypothetical protein [Nocardioidaceae bacterium]